MENLDLLILMGAKLEVLCSSPESDIAQSEAVALGLTIEWNKNK
jgi:hypothetical protein